ncbi:MAG: hypothetical protein V3V91_02555 [Thermoplasmata archaeon]
MVAFLLCSWNADRIQSCRDGCDLLEISNACRTVTSNLRNPGKRGEIRDVERGQPRIHFILRNTWGPKRKLALQSSPKFSSTPRTSLILLDDLALFIGNCDTNGFPERISYGRVDSQVVTGTMVNSTIVMRPHKDSKFYLVGFIILLLVGLPFLAYLLWDVLVQGEARLVSIVLFVVALIAIILAYDKVGKYIAISGKGISRPVLVMTPGVPFIRFEDMVGFKEEFSQFDKTHAASVRITTTSGKRIRYQERKTPGSCKALVDALRARGVGEEPE